jgi:anti-anti-sigma factor
MMQYSVSKNGSTVTVALSGRLTFGVQREFRAMLQEMASNTGGRWIVDLRKLEFIDSAGLGLLLRAKAGAEKAGAVASLRPPTEGQVLDILEIAHFSQMFEFV